MKTRIKKIIVMTVALLFVAVGVSFAHDGNHKHHKSCGNAHGHYKNGYDEHHGWHNKHHKPYRYTYGYYKKWHGHHHGWHKKYFKHRRFHRVRYVYKEVHHHYYDSHHQRRAPREDVIYKAILKDPNVVFKVIVKDHGFF